MKIIKKIGIVLSALSLFSCTNDRDLTAVNTELPVGEGYKIIHYWNFNDVTSLIKSS